MRKNVIFSMLCSMVMLLFCGGVFAKSSHPIWSPSIEMTTEIGVGDDKGECTLFTELIGAGFGVEGSITNKTKSKGDLKYKIWDDSTVYAQGVLKSGESYSFTKINKKDHSAEQVHIALYSEEKSCEGSGTLKVFGN